MLLAWDPTPSVHYKGLWRQICFLHSAHHPLSSPLPRDFRWVMDVFSGEIKEKRELFAGQKLPSADVQKRT